MFVPEHDQIGTSRQVIRRMAAFHGRLGNAHHGSTPNLARYTSMSLMCRCRVCRGPAAATAPSSARLSTRRKAPRAPVRLVPTAAELEEQRSALP
jgi:hypothetical protein